MIGMLFWLCLIATLVMAWRSRSQWEAYHRAAVTRTAMTNQLTLTIGLAIATVVLLVVRVLFKL